MKNVVTYKIHIIMVFLIIWFKGLYSKLIKRKKVAHVPFWVSKENDLKHWNPTVTCWRALGDSIAIS